MEKKFESAQARIYFEYLKEFPIEKISLAANRAIKELKWFPKISELIDLMQPKKPDLDYYSPFEEIGYKGKQLTHEEAKGWIDKIFTTISKQDAIKAEIREEKFLERKKILEAQKNILNGLN